MQGTAALPAVGTAAAGAYTTAGQRIGAALEASKYRKWMEITAKLAEGFLVPVSPVGASNSGKAGTLLAQAFDEIKRWHYRNNRTQLNATDI